MAANGISLNDLPTNTLNDVWGNSENDVYAVGNRGTILHYDGATWSKMNSGTTSLDFKAIWGSAADDIYVAGYYQLFPER